MRFSIVTPAYNMEHWIARTIESVLSQEGDFEIEYIIVDGGSSDKTTAIATSYAKQVAEHSYPFRCIGISIRVIPQSDSPGMYTAINEGFGYASGDVYAWINADDTYQPGAFQAIAIALAEFPDVQWIKGITDTVDESWQTVRAGTCRIYRTNWLRAGVYGREGYFIEQGSCFWRSSLWKEAGPIPSHLRSAGDYWLWISFAQHTPLWSLDTHVSNFMKREGQLSKVANTYRNEQAQMRRRRPFSAWIAKTFFVLEITIPYFERFFLWIYPILFGKNQYITIANGHAEKRVARSHVV